MKTSSCFFASWKLCSSLIRLNGNWAANLLNSPNHLINFSAYGVEDKLLILKTFFILILFLPVIFLGALPAMYRSILVLFVLLLFFHTKLCVISQLQCTESTRSHLLQGISSPDLMSVCSDLLRRMIWTVTGWK